MGATHQVFPTEPARLGGKLMYHIKEDCQSFSWEQDVRIGHLPHLTQGQTAMVGDQGINSRHEGARLGEGADDALVVLNVVVIERAAFAVL